ncbi:phage tail protein [Streptomyces scabiei]|uniref:Tetratricopeptide repeat protein n=1 Tax=Streptomyces scabiei TaxID=1930 RepID=A0A100JLV7_STRSC|nr:phage tail protein [Streptomyces scabiei]GAQ61827.1 tetratricopeptide repeat protein [Streptomyces scabiei]
MSEDRPVYDLLPAVHRNRDAELGHPLRALLEPVEEELRRLREDIDGLYDNWFVETCAEWVLPYLGDLLGVEPVAASPDGATPRRAFIANTLRHRRRKGTPATLEQPAQDITGLPAKVVEYFQLLGTTQHVNHPRLGNVRTPDLRDTGRLQLLGTPFDQVARTADVRHVDRGRGRYNLGAVGLHLWRLSSHPQLLVQARRGRQLPLTADFGHPATTADQGLEPRVRLSMTTQVGESLIERCDLTSATEVLTADADFDRVGWTWQGPALLARSRLHAAQGNPAAALAILHEYGAEENRARVMHASVPWRSRAALLHLALGQRTDALQLATEELELAHQWGTERAIGVASRCLGVIHGGRRGQALLREAVAVLKRSPARLELARAHYGLGTALMRGGKADEARQALTQALHLADTCGSVLLAGQVRGALTAAGVRPNPAPPAAPSLSPTEHRLVELLRAGHSDRQIAQALLLTPHDVTGLVEQAGRKLGVSSRAELASPA